MYHSIFKRCVTDQPIQFKPLIHIVGDFVFYDVTVKSNHIAVLPSLSVSSAQPLSKLNARADFPGIGYAPHRSSHLLGLQFREVFYTVTNIRTPQRTVSSMQRFAVSQKNRTEAITISPFSLHLLYRAENKQFSTLRCTKTGGTQLKLRAVCFVVQSCLADADFVVFSNYCLIGTRLTGGTFSAVYDFIRFLRCAVARRNTVDTSRIATAMLPATPAVSSPLCTAACTSPPRPRLIV